MYTLKIAAHIVRGHHVEVHLRSDGTDYEALPVKGGTPLALWYPYGEAWVPRVWVTGLDRADSLRTHGIDLTDHAMTSVRDEVIRLL